MIDGDARRLAEPGAIVIDRSEYPKLHIDRVGHTTEITGVRASAPRRSLVFEAVAGREYVLDYGNPRATAPHYDAERTVRALAGVRLTQATLGPPAPVPPPPRAPWLDAQPVVMWAAMAVAVLAFGALLVRLARSVRTI